MDERTSTRRPNSSARGWRHLTRARVLGLHAGRQRRCGTSASRHWARSPYSLERGPGGKDGKTLRCPPIASGRISGPSTP